MGNGRKKEINRQIKNMKILLGEKGLNLTWQESFEKEIKCNKCKSNCRPMFVVFEEENEKEYVSSLYPNMEDKKLWPHDAIACAVYLCEKCFEPNAVINQA